MRTNSIHAGTFCALLVLTVTLAACGGGGTTITPGAAPTPTVSSLPASAYTTASCLTTGTASANVTGSLVALGTITTPAIGGCSYSNNLGLVITGGATGTYAGTISFAAPPGLPAITNAPPGFSATNFVPLFYVTLQLSGFTGQISPDNPSINVTVNSIVTSTNSLNFFIGSWSSNALGATPPVISATSFSGWSNNDSVTALTNVPLTVTPPNTLSLPAFPCSPAANCAPTADVTPTSYTLVQVVGYFT